MAAQHAGQSGFFLPSPSAWGWLSAAFSSLSLQTAALHWANRQMAGQWRQRQASDGPGFGAQQVAAQLQAPTAACCKFPSSQWPRRVAERAPASPGSVKGRVGSLPAYRLVEWWPWLLGLLLERMTATGRLGLRLELGGGRRAVGPRPCSWIAALIRPAGAAC